MPPVANDRWADATRAVSVLLALVLILIGGAAGTSLAADANGFDELARLTVVTTRILAEAKVETAEGRYGFAKDGHFLFGAAIKPKDWVRITIPARADQEYRLIVAGDARAEDVDVKVTSPAGRIVAEDARRDPTAAVRFRAASSGQYAVTVTLFKATATSFCGLVILQREGWAIPVANLSTAMGAFMRSAAGTGVLMERLSGGRVGIRLENGTSGCCLFGSVLRQDQVRTVPELVLGDGVHVFWAAGCDQATDIDLEVTDQNGTVIARDVADDATPMGIAVTTAGARYDVETSMPVSRGPALALTGVLKLEPASGQQIRPAAGGR